MTSRTPSQSQTALRNRRFSATASASLVLALAAWAMPDIANAETKTLTLDSKGLKSLRIDAAAGELIVEGMAGSTQIEVVADVVDDERDYRLTLTKQGDRAVLISDTEGWIFWVGHIATIDLRVKVPHGLTIDIDDGSGELRMKNTVGKARIDDGSGAIEIQNHRGDLDIEDGSGSIDISGVVGDVYVDDGSGRTSITNVDGKVTVDDGSGSLRIENVTKGLVILDAGSGDLSTNKIAGGIDDRS
jgi:hypothetical protein